MHIFEFEVRELDLLESLLEGPGFLLGTDTNGNLEDHPRIRKSLVTMGVSELTLGRVRV